MDKAHPLSSPMIVRSLDAKKDHFRPKEENEAPLGPEVPYLSARFNSAPTRGHWNDVKHILRYLHGTIDLGLFHSNESTLKEYADFGYLPDPHKTRSQTGYVFTCGNTVIS